MARPTTYSDELLEKVKEYRDNLPADENIHTIEGLAGYAGIARSTIYEWASQEDKKEFSDIISEILEKQGKQLVNKGLSGDYNPTISKVLLTKHGYREGHDVTSDDKPIENKTIVSGLDRVYGGPEGTGEVSEDS